MSSIMDRLRRVEGTTSVRSVGGEKKEVPRKGDGTAARQTPEEGLPNRASTPIGYRALAGALAILAIFVVGRVWKGETPRRPAGRSREVRAERSGTLHGGESPTGGTLLISIKQPLDNDGKPGAETLRSDASAPLSARQAASVPDSPRKNTNLPQSGEAWASGGGFRPDGESASVPAQLSRKNVLAGDEAGSEGVLTAEENERTKSLLLGLKVAGVYRDADGYVALIDGRELQKGDKMGDIEIVEIASEKITFGLKGKLYNLPLRR